MDKKLYWERRKNGLRGQGEKPIVSKRNEKLSKTKSSRLSGLKRMVFRYSTPALPLHDPKETNHMRALRCKAEREAKRQSKHE